MTRDQYKILREDVDHLKVNIQKVETTLATVSANGRQGLENSLKDLYNKNVEIQKQLNELKLIVEPIVERGAWLRLTKKVFDNSWMGKVHRSKPARYVVLFIVVILVNTVLHSFGIVLDIPAMLKVIPKLVGL